MEASSSSCSKSYSLSWGSGLPIITSDMIGRTQASSHPCQSLSLGMGILSGTAQGGGVPGTESCVAGTQRQLPSPQ